MDHFISKGPAMTPPQPRVITIADLPELANPGGRDEGLTLRLIADGSTGASEYVAVHTEFPPGHGHEIHRHPRADQLICVMSGSLVHTTIGSSPRTLRVGDVLHAPAGAWHGLHNETTTSASAVAMFGGIADGRDAGFERHDAPGPTMTPPLT
jgi:quercetin dioxygenase-like cupin family protein